jgi:succinoglycan biosynthesis transport protein ExoP
MGPGNEFDIRLCWRVLKKHRWLFTGSLLLTLSLTLWFSYTPPVEVEPPSVFNSSTKLIVTPPRSAEEESDESVRQWFASEQLLKQLVLSKDVLQRVVQAGELEEDWKDLKGQITLAPVNEGQEWSGLMESFLIQLDVRADSPEKAKKISELMVSELIIYTQEMSAREAIASRRLLEEMAAENKARIEKAQQEIVDWRKRNDVWDVNQLIEAQGEKIADLKEQKREHRVDIDYLEDQLETVAAYRAGQGDSLPSEARAAGTSKLEELNSSLNSENARLEELRKIYLDSNDAVRNQMAIVQDVRERVDQQRGVVAASARATIQEKIAKHRSAMARLDMEVEDLKGDEKLANSQVQLEELQRSLGSLQANNEDLEGQLNHARVLEEKRRHLGAFTVVEEAQLGNPVSSQGGSSGRPFREKMLLSTIFSLIVASGLVLVFHYHLEHSRLRPQVEEALSQPVLGLIPNLDKKFSTRWSEARTDSQEHFLVYSSPSSTAAEQFRTLVVNLMNQPEPPKRILVTSCWPGDGKSLVCANLAASLTKFHHKVDLVDGDMRRPHLTRALRQQDSIGIRECLERDIPVEEAFQSTGVDGLTFLPAGKGEANAAELLAKDERLTRLFESQEEGRILLVDSPPISVCSDALQLGALLDGVILVVNQANWDGKAEKEYVEDLLDHEIPILGIVLNRLTSQEISYGYKDRYLSYYA